MMDNDDHSDSDGGATSKSRAKRGTATRPTYRANKHLIGGYYTEPTHRQFKILAAQLGMGTEETLAQALHLLFLHHRKEVPAELPKKHKGLGFASDE